MSQVDATNSEPKTKILEDEEEDFTSPDLSIHEDAEDMGVDDIDEILFPSSGEDETRLPPKKRRNPLRTNRGPRAKYWCFTENDAVGIVDILEAFNGDRKFHPNITYICGQVEEGKENHAHFQGYLELNTRKRIPWLKTNLSKTAHFERRRGTQKEAIDYCKKNDTRVDGPYEFGTPTKQFAGKRNDIIMIKELADTGVPIEEIAKNDEHFGTMSRIYKYMEWYTSNCCLISPTRDGNTETKVILLIGAAGTGKTFYAMRNYPKAYWKPSQSKWWDGYKGESEVIFDDFNHGWFPWDTLMRVLDRYPMKVEKKGSYIDLCATTVVITTNTHPRFWYKNMGDKYPALRRRLRTCLHFVDPEEP
jgi:hypothetical protein